MPLFIVSVIAFVSLVVLTRPVVNEGDLFDDEYHELVELSDTEQFTSFYEKAEALRLVAADETQLGRVHLLVAKTRADELEIRGCVASGGEGNAVVAENLNNIISDYEEAVKREVVTADDNRGMYWDIASCYWLLGDVRRSMSAFEKVVAFGLAETLDAHKEYVIALLVTAGSENREKALNIIDEILAASSQDEGDVFSWFVVKRVAALIGQGDEAKALAVLASIDINKQPPIFGDEMKMLKGRALRQIGGRDDEADILLRDLYATIETRGFIYAQVALELGKINYAQFRDREAARFYSRVLVTQSGNEWYWAGKLGLAQCASMHHRYEEALGIYRDLAEFINKTPINLAISKGDIRKNISVIAGNLRDSKDYVLAKQFLDIQQEVIDDDDYISILNYAEICELVGSQYFEESISEDSVKAGKHEKWLQQQRALSVNHFNKSAENYIKLANVVIEDDKLSGMSLWRSAKAYDKAGETEKSIEVWLRIVTERDADANWPQALYNLGQAYRAIGKQGEALTYFEILNKKHKNSPAAFSSFVPMAKCYLALEEPDVEKAELLLQQVRVNQAITPMAPVYKDALFVLGDLYYGNQQYPQAINVLAEAIDRYPEDKRIGSAKYLVGESYRQSGLKIGDQFTTATDNNAVRLQEAMSLKRRHLESAEKYFGDAIIYYQNKGIKALSEMDSLYLKSAWLNRSDCLFDLQRYDKALDLYEATVLRYQLTPTALSAFVQIINCNVKLGNLGEAKSAKQRAVWQLRKMEDNMFVASNIGFTRKEWDEWFNWYDNAGFWN